MKSCANSVKCYWTSNYVFIVFRNRKVEISNLKIFWKTMYQRHEEQKNFFAYRSFVWYLQLFFSATYIHYIQMISKRFQNMNNLHHQRHLQSSRIYIILKYSTMIIWKNSVSLQFFISINWCHLFCSHIDFLWSNTALKKHSCFISLYRMKCNQDRKI